MHRTGGLIRSLLGVLRNYHFWCVLVLFVAVFILHYPQQLHIWHSAPFSFLGLTRHSIERVFLLLPVAYASYIFGIRGGIASLVVAASIMMPRTILISANPVDALFESIGIIVIGCLINLWFYIQNRNMAIRKRLEESLRTSEKSFRELFEVANEAIWLHDLKGNITMANKACERLTGYAVEQLLGANVRAFLREESLSLAKEVRHKLLLNQHVDFPYEQRILRKDGTEAICMIATNLLTRNGKPSAFQNIATDITAERRLYENLRFYLQEITRAQEEERKRIARELHDSTAQTLIALLHQLENLLADKTKMPFREAKILWGFHEQLKEVLQEIRRFSRDLRPSILDDLGLLPALEWLTSELEREYGIDARLKVVGNNIRLSPEAELLLFRIVQEALRNTAKHARASVVEIKLEYNKTRLTVTIRDNGTGFQLPENLGALPHMGKLGLAGMQERAQLLSGSLKITSEPGKGTTIVVDVPV